MTAADNKVFFLSKGGGWTIVGWYCKGQIMDASAQSNNAGSPIASDNHPIDISYLYPTHQRYLAGVSRYPRGESAASKVEN
jgi:hypothetical protein